MLLFLPLFLLAVPFLTPATRIPRHFAVGFIAVVLAMIPAGCWILRNWYVADFASISSVTAVNMLKYKAAGVEAELHGTTREIERDRLTKECEAELPATATQGDRYRLWQRRGAGILLSHPLATAKVHVQGMIVELIGPERDNTTRLLYGPAVLDATGNHSDASVQAAWQEHPIAILEMARKVILGWQGLLALCLLVGVGQLALTRKGLLALLLVVPLYVLVLSAGPEGSPRFRVLYLPVFSLFTALGATALLSTARSRLVPLFSRKRGQKLESSLARGQQSQPILVPRRTPGLSPVRALSSVPGCSSLRWRSSRG
jgi:hypothetical protein